MLQWDPRTDEDLSYAARIAFDHRQAEAAVLAGWSWFNRATNPVEVDAAIRFLTAAVLDLDWATFHADCVALVIVPDPEAKAVADAWRKPAA